jgi:hypothetical protein
MACHVYQFNSHEGLAQIILELFFTDRHLAGFRARQTEEQKFSKPADR